MKQWLPEKPIYLFRVKDNMIYEKNPPDNNKTTLFDDLQKGLIQAIDFANGAESAWVITENVDATKKDEVQHSQITIQPETE